MNIMRAVLAVCVLALVLSAGCMGGTSSSSSPTSAAAPSSTTTTTVGLDMVTLRDNYFENGNRTVAPGTMVTFQNLGAHAHTVTIHKAGDPLDVTRLNQTLQPGQSTVFVFTEPSMYHVWCRFHGTMTTGMAMTMTVPHAS